MRGVVFRFCLIASAVEFEIDTHGAMYERRPRTSITGAGGIAGVLEALRTHPKIVEVQREGLSTLENLAVDANNRRSIAEEDGIAVVLEALRTHPKDVEVQRQGLSTLWNLAGDANNKRSIARSDGIAVVLEALRTHP